jgi:hypothetical protein
MAHRATACECLRRQLSGEPDAGNLHVRFYEGGGTSSPTRLAFFAGIATNFIPIGGILQRPQREAGYTPLTNNKRQRI